MNGTTRRHVTSDTVRRLNHRKIGCRMRLARHSVRDGEWGWLVTFDRDWQSGLTCEVRRVRK